MNTICVCPSWEYACNIETKLIEIYNNLYNLAKGGSGGFVVPKDKIEQWKYLLKAKREGRKPLLGMKHTDSNKELFSKISKNYWATMDTYDPEKVCSISFKKANKLYGISKTHYYRLRKRLLTND